MERQQLLLEITKLMQGKYRRFIAILDNTKEIASSLASGDRISTSLLLEIRKNEMLEADSYEEKIECLLEGLDEVSRHEINQWRKAKGTMPIEQEAGMLYSMALKLKKTVEQTIEIDKIINHRIAGKNSFYE